MDISERKNDKTVRLVRTALMICLILVGTILIRIPVPMTQGYVHLGDAMIYLGVILLGRRDGAAAAALGSAMADILGGFAFWAPWTLVIKFLMAMVTGLIMDPDRHNKNLPRDLIAMTAGGIVMCAGYLAAERVMYGSWGAAALGLPWNAGQFIAGMAAAVIISSALARRAGSAE